jgi:lipoprotein signal peptidase
MNREARTSAVWPVRLDRTDRAGQRLTVLALLTVVAVLDQGMKWWAWRHAPVAIINGGGDPLVGATVSGWYSGPVTGALLDLLDFGLLSAAVAVLMRRRRPVKVLVPAALVIGGWSSNLLDRLGMHYWTAPGSMRGAVDFLHLGGHYYNVADFFIIGATPVFFLVISHLCIRAMNGTVRIGPVASIGRARMRMATWMSLFAGALALIGVVGIGAADDAGVTNTVASSSARSVCCCPW